MYNFLDVNNGSSRTLMEYFTISDLHKCALVNKKTYSLVHAHINSIASLRDQNECASLLVRALSQKVFSHGLNVSYQDQQVKKKIKKDLVLMLREIARVMELFFWLQKDLPAAEKVNHKKVGNLTPRQLMVEWDKAQAYFMTMSEEKRGKILIHLIESICKGDFSSKEVLQKLEILFISGQVANKDIATAFFYNYRARNAFDSQGKLLLQADEQAQAEIGFKLLQEMKKEEIQLCMLPIGDALVLAAGIGYVPLVTLLITLLPSPTASLFLSVAAKKALQNGHKEIMQLLAGSIQ